MVHSAAPLLATFMLNNNTNISKNRQKRVGEENNTKCFATDDCTVKCGENAIETRCRMYAQDEDKWYWVYVCQNNVVLKTEEENDMNKPVLDLPAVHE